MKNLSKFNLLIISIFVLAALTNCMPLNDDSRAMTQTAQSSSENGDNGPVPTLEEDHEIESNPTQITGSADSSEDVLWVDNITGDDSNSGLSSEEPFASIQRALDNAYPGVFIRIVPGVYRESLTVIEDGTPDAPITLLSDQGPGSVIIRGSEPSNTLVWEKMTEDNVGFADNVSISEVFSTDLTAWGLTEPPRYIVELDDNGGISTRYMPAREPDYYVEEEWRFNEFWWSANGGQTVASCNPIMNIDHDCDLPNRSYFEMTDTADDSDPVGIEAGNLTSFGDLTGATLVAMDAHHAHYNYRRNIVSSDPLSGKITVDEECEREGEPGLGWGSKYYIENHPALLDKPGEWWFNTETNMLYFWSPGGKDPGSINLEISRLETGFDASNASHIVLVGMQIELYNGNAYEIRWKDDAGTAIGNQILNSQIQYANKGVYLYHYVSGADDELGIIGFQLENSIIANIDTTAFDSYFSWDGLPLPDNFTQAGIRDITIRNNIFHHIGFNSDHRSAVGIRIFYPDQLIFEGNHVHHIAQNGIHLHLSVVDSPDTYDLDPDEIKIGEILLKDNIFEKTCQAASDCGGLKIGGSNRPYSHVFRDVLVIGNTMRHVYGWSYVSIQRDINDYGDGNGFYLDYATGVHVFRNIAYDNTGAGFKLSCLWRDDDMILYNNLAVANFLYGIKTTGLGECDNHQGSVNTQFVNNIISHNGLAGIEFLSTDNENYGNLIIDHNLYFQNGWDKSIKASNVDILLYHRVSPDLKLRGISKIQEKTGWEVNGIFGDPGFEETISLEDHRYQYPDWRLLPLSNSSPVIDAGSIDLPESLINLLQKYQIEDVRCGPTYDIGPYEFCNSLP